MTRRCAWRTLIVCPYRPLNLAESFSMDFIIRHDKISRTPATVEQPPVVPTTDKWERLGRAAKRAHAPAAELLINSRNHVFAEWTVMYARNDDKTVGPAEIRMARGRESRNISCYIPPRVQYTSTPTAHHGTARAFGYFLSNKIIFGRRRRSLHHGAFDTTLRVQETP